MSLKELLFKLPLKLKFQRIGASCYCTKTVDTIIKSAEEQPVYLEDDTTNLQIEKKRNKSRLKPYHRNMLFGKNPYEKVDTWYQERIRYKKRVLGRYGLNALDVPAGFVWPTPEEIAELQEFEDIAHPKNIQERLQKIKEEKRQREEAMMARQNEISNKMANMQKMINDVQQKIVKKQAAEEEAKMRKERKIEAIRRELIAQGAMGKDKLADALAKAEKEEKKMKKEAKKAKKLERQTKMVEYLKKQAMEENTEVEEEDETETKK